MSKRKILLMLMPVGVASAYILASAISIWLYGYYALVPAFCIGTFCYPALPSSLIILGGLTIYLSFRYYIFAFPMIFMGAAIFDIIGTSFAPSNTVGFLYAWLIMIGGGYAIARPKILTWKYMLLYYIFISTTQLIRFSYIDPHDKTIWLEPLSEIVFSVCFVKTFAPADWLVKRMNRNKSVQQVANTTTQT